MDASSPPSGILSLSSAFATACRLAHSDAELFQFCRDALTRRFGTDQIWFSVSNHGRQPLALPAPGAETKTEEVFRIGSGKTEVTILADAAIAPALRSEAPPLALGLSVMLELHAVLQERQAQLDDAGFQLRALRQVARLLSSVHSSEETEHLVLDFVAEVFSCRWACLYRPVEEVYAPRVVRSPPGTMIFEPVPRLPLDRALPAGSGAYTTDDAGIATFFPTQTRLVVSLETGIERLAVLALGPRVQDQPFGNTERELAGTLAFAAAIALKNSELVEALQSAATTDPLTGLRNRRAMEERLEAELARTQRHQIRTSVVLIDVDRFKMVNDTLGHAAGDRLLVEVGRVLQQQCRALDAVGRMGGDEFLVVLPMTTAEESLVFTARLQKAVAKLESRLPEFGLVTLSMGVAEAPRHGPSTDGLLAAADAALYRAKRGGRNAVERALDT